MRGHLVTLGSAFGTTLRMGLAAALAISLTAASPAWAASDVDNLHAGVAAYDGLEYERAVSLLTSALDAASAAGAESLTRDERILALRTLAMAEFALNRDAETRAAFERLLSVDPAQQLDRKLPPRLRALLEEVRAKLATQPRAKGPPEGLEPVSPTVRPEAPHANRPLEIAVPQPTRRAAALNLYYRSGNARAYSRADAQRSSGGYAITLPGTAVHAPSLEYYAVLLDAEGAPVAGAGSLGDPLELPVAPERKPIYKKGWFWGVISTVVVAGVVATALGLTLAPKSPASVTIMPK